MADTYTIQFRRGMYADFDTSKIRPGKPVAILGNDKNAEEQSIGKLFNELFIAE